MNGHLTALRDRHDVSRTGLVRLACQSVWGEVDDAFVGEDGRLRVESLQQRLEITTCLAAVLRLVWEGKRDKEIAHELRISVHTAANYRRRLRRKLRAQTSTLLVREVYHALARR